jgi:aminoglycoside phosphotransferase (APT) family kinase protein
MPPPAAPADQPPAPAAAPDGGPGTTTAGIDVERVTAWCTTHVPDAVPPLSFELVAGGRSNLTYRVLDSAGRSFVLRRPPVSHVLPTAHDMAREYRVMTALGPTDVPVPATFGLCTDEDVNGAPFYVMEYVDGHILRDRATAEAAFAEPARRAIGTHMADTLAALHAVDVDAVGLGDLGRREGYVERQLRRWGEQYRQMAVPGVDHGTLVEEVGAALAAAVPPAAGATIVHGDYRLDNVVLDGAGRVAAVLDWEICTLGDPMADVGLLMVYWAAPDDGEPILGTAAPTTAPGFAGRDEVLARYAEASGRDVSDVGFYMAFGYWKLACILQGVFARYAAGAGAGDPNSVDTFPATVDRLARLAADTLASR